MTNREFYTAIAAGEMNDELKEHATAALEKMEATREKNASKPSKAYTENLPLVEKVVAEFLGEEPKTAADCAEFLEVKTQKATSILKQAVAMGKATQTEIKLPKKGNVKAYALA